MKHVDGRITVIPVHPRENIGVGLLLKIVKDAKLDREEFIKLLAKTWKSVLLEKTILI